MVDGVNVGPISGFPEWLPAERLLEQRVLDTLRHRYELFGFAPIETPAVERLEVLTAKGGVERQIYTLGRPAEDGRDAQTSLGLHFDLTVPLARYVAAHRDQLVFPFRRYQIQKVWRGERAQRGRYREFTQCDIDVVGDGSLSLAHDAELPVVIDGAFDAIGVGDFRVHISNRRVLTGLLGVHGITGEQAVEALRLIDRHDRSRPDRTEERLRELGAPDDLLKRLSPVLASDDLGEVRELLAGVDPALKGLDQLAEVVDRAVTLGVAPDRLVTDFSIARGLDYYTGTVYETFVGGREAWGSVCSGGRYDDLTQAFTDRAYPGVGVSIGLSRLLALLIADGRLVPGPQVPTQVLVTTLDPEHHLDDYLALGRELREGDLPTEVNLEPGALRDQIAYASRKGIPLAVIAGAREFAAGTVTVRDLRDRSQATIPRADLLPYLRARTA